MFQLGLCKCQNADAGSIVYINTAYDSVKEPNIRDQLPIHRPLPKP